MRKNNYSDFNENERLIAKYLADIFKEQIPDEEIPKPDLSFMYADDDGLGSFAGPGIGSRRGVSSLLKKKRRIVFASPEAEDCPPRRKRRFAAVRRVATAFCVICTVFVVSSGMVTILLDHRTYADNHVMNLLGRGISYVMSQPEGNIDYSDESYDSKEIFEESNIYIIKKALPEMMVVGEVPERYKFASLKLEEYGTGHFTYTYEYKNPSNPDDLLHIEGCKRKKNEQIILFGSNVRINSVNFELYCQDDTSTGGVTGTYLLSNQMLVISGKLSQDEVINIAKSLAL